jgi:hypothetical protein
LLLLQQQTAAAGEQQAHRCSCVSSACGWLHVCMTWHTCLTCAGVHVDRWEGVCLKVHVLDYRVCCALLRSGTCGQAGVLQLCCVHDPTVDPAQ